MLYKESKTTMNLYKSNSLAGKFTKAKALKIQGELYEKEEKLKKETSMEQREVGREDGVSLRNWKSMFSIPQAHL